MAEAFQEFPSEFSFHRKIAPSVPSFSKSVNIIENSEVIFNPFKCSELQTEFLRNNDNNNCFIIQKLSNAFEIKSNDFDKNTWQNPQIIRYLDNKDGGKIITHSWNNVVQWGEKSNKQPFSHLVVLDIIDLNTLFSSKLEISGSNLHPKAVINCAK